MRYLFILLILLLIGSESLCAGIDTNRDSVIAFPGAEGFGKYTTGGRGGKVIIVANLNDHGQGSLREALEQSGPRIVVFAVSGTIGLESILNISSGDVTVAGQSAPGDGICIRNYAVRINADNVIIRYLRFRLGDSKAQQDDAITGLRHRYVIVDHCSMSWATDECASFYDNEYFTLQWCIISESLNASVHEKGNHGYGGIWGGRGASFHHNLIASHSSRNPRFCGARYHKQPEREIVDYSNNVIYNWGMNSVYGGEQGNHNLVNNYYKAGPATKEVVKDRIVNPFRPYGKFFVSGNVIEGNAQVSQNNRSGIQCEHADSTYAYSPFPVMSIKLQSAADAYEAVLKSAGASLKRDAVDTRVVSDVKQGKATSGKAHTGIIDSQNDVGGWPSLQTQPSPKDADRDGMDDAWEVKHKLNPANGSDGASYTLDKTYTNVEIYLNGLIR